MALKAFNSSYAGKRVLVTGHSGFKGSWLTLWLHEMGAQISAISHPDSENVLHWRALKLKIDEHYQDIGNLAGTAAIIQRINPEIIFHLAAQPLVRESYAHPMDTWMTNVIGTGNVLESARHCSSLKAIVVVTTDKCYRNNEWPWGYRENDHLGGHDPYSASKAGAELIAASYRSSFFNNPTSALLATARAGNVIGGGDWSKDRLIPDAARALQNNAQLVIRSPRATRPWQHVLECLSGYLLLGQRLLGGDRSVAEAWNFGPSDEGNLQVQSLLELMQRSWPQLKWQVDEGKHPHEASLLMLDCAKAKSLLKWRPVWNITETAGKTAAWYKEYSESGRIISQEQLLNFVEDARIRGIQWAD